jgi:hypothetical protein
MGGLFDRREGRRASAEEESTTILTGEKRRNVQSDWWQLRGDKTWANPLCIVTLGGGILKKGRGGHPSNDGYKGRMRGGEARARMMRVGEIRAV